MSTGGRGTYAPIALFTYARPDHTRAVIEALKRNTLAKASNLIVYSDAARTAAEEERVRKVRRYLHTVDGFQSVKIVESPRNLGLAQSITAGISETIEEWGKIIVLEDDILTSPCFLEFMNCALERFQNQRRVWHVSGWNYPIDSSGLSEAFLIRVMNCWGWATWRDRWVHFRKRPTRLLASWHAKDIYAFNLDGAHDFWRQVVRNAEGSLDTWAIFWYATIFENRGLCVNPSSSCTENIGLDGSGTNSGRKFLKEKITLKETFAGFGEFPLVESDIALQRIRRYYLRRRVRARIRQSWQRASGLLRGSR